MRNHVYGRTPPPPSSSSRKNRLHERTHLLLHIHTDKLIFAADNSKTHCHLLNLLFPFRNKLFRVGPVKNLTFQCTEFILYSTQIHNQLVRSWQLLAEFFAIAHLTEILTLIYIAMPLRRNFTMD